MYLLTRIISLVIDARLRQWDRLAQRLPSLNGSERLHIESFLKRLEAALESSSMELLPLTTELTQILAGMGLPSRFVQQIVHEFASLSSVEDNVSLSHLKVGLQSLSTDLQASRT